MKAAVMKDIGLVEVEDVPEPETTPNRVKVKIAYCGICGTDIERLENRFGLRPWTGKPSIEGHESSGTIAEVGAELGDQFKVGQKVAMNFRSACGACYYCRNKMEHYCQNPYRASGAFAEYAVYNAGAIFLLPDDVSLEHGALLEPISVALHAVDLANVRPGSLVMISGMGPIGLLILQLASKSGAARIMVSEPIESKRDLAIRMGADIAVNPINDKVEDMARKLTDGKGFDGIVESSGNIGAAKQSLALAGKCATIVWMAVYPPEAEIGIKPFQMFANELTLRSAFISPYSFHRALAILPKLDLNPIISHIISLQTIKKAFELHKKGDAIKILIKP